MVYGCAPQVVLAVPQEVKPQAEAISIPVVPDTRRLVGEGTKAVLASQVTPSSWFDVTEDNANDFGTVIALGVFWIRIPPKAAEPAVLAALLLIVAFLMSKPAPSRRMPPAVLLLTLTWFKRTIAPPSPHRPGEPPVMVRLRM
jgi:hypothetical protein